MPRRAILFSLPVLLLTGLTPSGRAASPITSLKVPIDSLGFEPNRGQAPPEVRYLRRAPGSLLLVSERSLTWKTTSAKATSSLRLECVNGSSSKLTPEDPLPGRVNYLLGNEPAAWRQNIPTFAKIRFTDLYPGIDLVFYTRDGELEFDLLLKPHANASAIAMRIAAQEPGHVDFRPVRPRLTGDGDLIYDARSRQMKWRKPLLFSERPVHLNSTGREEVHGNFVVQETGLVGFAVEPYDRNAPLTIDPVLTYSTYLGGTDDEGIFGIRQDAAGNLYVAGETSSLDFPLRTPEQNTLGGNYDGFVLKFDPTGTQLIYSSFLGGSGYDHCIGLALAPDGSVSVAGTTQSADFPLFHAVQSSLKGTSDAFVSRLDPSGSTLLFSTYLGGSSFETAGGIALGPDQSTYVTGQSRSRDFPTSAGAFQGSCDGLSTARLCVGDAYVTRFSPTGAILYSTYLGGIGFDAAVDIVVDDHGQALVAGSTSSQDFPVMRASQAKNAGTQNAFLSRLSADGTDLVFSTYFGGKESTESYGLAMDGAHNAYLVGATSSPDLPVRNPFQSTYAGGPFDGFVAKFDAKGRVAYASYLGGQSIDIPFRVAVDSSGQAVIVGFTQSPNFPLAAPVQASYAGKWDAFVTRVASTGDRLLYSTYLGGAGDDFGYAIFDDGAGDAWVGGSTSSSVDFPLLNPYQPTYAGGPFDAFLSRLTDSNVPPASTSPENQQKP